MFGRRNGRVNAAKKSVYDTPAKGKGMGACFSVEEYEERSLSLIGALSEKLMLRQLLLGTAESCTGGMLAALCTELPGSSRWFAGGIVCYADAVKTAALGVEPALLREHGAVSAPVAEAMALGALRLPGIGLALALSGIAGPGGGSAEKPVGTVWIAAGIGGRHMPEASRGGRIAVRRHRFSGDRRQVRRAAVIAALRAALALLDGSAP
jgi:nicotinamide-nucleotide amidase